MNKYKERISSAMTEFYIYAIAVFIVWVVAVFIKLDLLMDSVFMSLIVGAAILTLRITISLVFKYIMLLFKYLEKRNESNT